jgi:lantibiotic leader peptide-processing serine protease
MYRLSRLLPAVALVFAACTDEPTAPTRLAPDDARFSGVPSGRAAVVFTDETAIPASGLSLIASLGGTVTSRYDSIGVAFATGLSAAALETLAGDPSVLGVALDQVLNWLPGVRVGGAIEADAIAPTNHQDPTKVPWWFRQWGLRQIQADKAWAAGYFSNSSVRVAILDTGIDYNNRELKGLVDLTLSKSFVPDDPTLPTDHPVMDLHFHGTHVSSTVVTNNRTIAGVAPHTTLVGVKVLSFLGSGSFEGVIGGIVYAADIRSHVINMSLGTDVDLNEPGVKELIRALSRAIRYAEKKGTLVISAAGNDAFNLDDPAIGFYVPCEVSSICVSATGPILQQNFDQPASYTNYGISAIEVAAPGGNVDPDGNDQVEDLIIGACSSQTTQPGLAPCRANQDVGTPYFYAWAAGTSMATPHVSGVAAMIKASSPMLKTNALKNRIIDFSDDLGAPGLDPFYGYGRVNVYRSLLKQ